MITHLIPCLSFLLVGIVTLRARVARPIVRLVIIQTTSTADSSVIHTLIAICYFDIGSRVITTLRASFRVRQSS